MLNKKGDVGVSEWLEQIPEIILTAIVMIGIFVLVNYYINLNVNVKPLESEVLFYRMMYSPNAIMYTGQVTGIVYPGIIELDNFTNETLDKAIQYSSERHIAAKLTIFNMKNEVVTSAYLSNIWFNRLEPLAKAPVAGAGSATLYARKIPIVYRQNGVNQAGFLLSEIIVPN